MTDEGLNVKKNLEKVGHAAQAPGEALKNLVRSASDGNPSKLKELLSPIMADKVTDHLATKKIEVARDFIGSPPEEGVLDNE
tara:strand:- start:192 stop:437 length:246 start_codon:yes stop_codon:yes gene_type:complete